MESGTVHPQATHDQSSKEVKVFICWSGTGGKEIAHATADWLKSTIPESRKTIEPVVSMNIDKGDLWFTRVTEHLSRSSAGIICLTERAITSPWLHFEA